MAIRDQGGISASDIANAAAAHAVGTLTLDVSADVKQSLLDFLSTANRMVSGSQLGKYFADTETLAKRLGDTVNACGKQFRNLDDSKAKELVNTFNALNSRAGGADISKYFANFTGGFDRVNEAVTRAQGRVGKFIEGFRMEDFNRMFASYDNIVEWTTALGGSKQTVDELIRSLVQLNGADVNSLTARLTTAQQEITRLNNELASAKSGQGFVELQKQIESLTEKLQTAQTEINRVRATAESEFSGFLNGNNINENAWDEATAKPMFQEYFEQIRDGSMTARDAIMRFKEEYGHLLRDRTGSESGLFSSEQVSQFIAKLEEVYIKVEEIGNYIRNIGNNAPGLITNAVEKDLQNISKEEQALRHVVDEGGQVGRVGQIVDGVASAVSSGTQKMGEMSEQTVKLVDALTNLGQAGEGSLAAISAIFRNIGTIKDLEVNTDQFKKLKDALEILKDTTGLDKIGLLSNINLQGFSNLKISTTLGHLATYLPPISQNVDVAKLEALSHISLANFNQDNLKVSKASMEHLRDLLAQIQGKPLQTINNGQTQQLSEEQAMVERLNTTWKIHSDAVAQAIEDEQRKSVISTELTAKLQHEKEAMDAVSGSAERGAASGQKYSSVWDKMFLGKFVAEFAKVKAQFDALEDKPAKLAENMRKLESAERDMHAATNMKDRVDAYERFTTILDVVRTQIGAVNAEARNSNADFKSLLNMVKQAGSAMDGIANSSFTNKLKEMSAKAKGVADESVIRNLKEMRQAYVDMQSAYGTSGPNTEQDYTALINAQIRWKTALNGLNQALTTNRTESAAVNAANREAAQTVKAIADGAAAAEKQVASLNSVFEGLRDKTKFDTSSFDQMRALLDVVNNTSMDTSVRQSALQQLNDLIKQNTDSLHELAAAEKAEADAKKKTDTADRQKAALIKQLNTLLAQCTNAEQRYAIVSKAAFAKENYQGIKDTKTYVQQLLQQLNGTNPKLEEIAVGARNAQTAFSNFNTSLKTSGGLLGNWLTTGMSQLKSRLTYSLGLAAMVYKAVGEVKKMVSTAVELDSAMNTLQIVTRSSGAEMEAYGKRVSSMAKETAQATKDLIDATTVYARLGYSMDESATLSKYTAMLQGVGGIDASAAQDAITAIIKAFGKGVDDIEDIMNKMVVVGNNFPISVSQIAEGMNNAGSMLAVANNSFEQSIALLTAANTTIQNISKASTGLRTIAARIRKTTTGEDDGEIVEEAKYQEMVNALTKQHVNLVDEVTGQYRSTYDIMRDIASVWNKLNSMEQAAVIEALAGTRQQNIFTSLVTQFQEAEGAMKRMNNSAGELQESYNIYLDSIQAHVQTLKAAYDELSRDFIDSDFAKSAVDILTKIVEALDFLIEKFGVWKTALGAIGGVAALKNLKTLTSLLFATDATRHGQWLFEAPGKLEKLAEALFAVNPAILAAVASAGLLLAGLAKLDQMRSLEYATQQVNQTKKELDELNKKRDENNQKIEYLNTLKARGDFTVQQETELTILQMQNTALQAQIDLLEQRNQKERERQQDLARERANDLLTTGIVPDGQIPATRATSLATAVKNYRDWQKAAEAHPNYRGTQAQFEAASHTLEKMLHDAPELIALLDPEKDKDLIDKFNLALQETSDTIAGIPQHIRDARNELEQISKGGNVNLLQRPVIDAKILEAAGWGDFEDGEGATVFSSTFSNEDETIAMNFTPIITDVDGNYIGAFTPEQLQQYAEGVIAGTHEDTLHLKIGATFEGPDALKLAEDEAEKVHKLHELVYEQDLKKIQKFHRDVKQLSGETMNAIKKYLSDGTKLSKQQGDELKNFLDTFGYSAETFSQMLSQMFAEPPEGFSDATQKSIADLAGFHDELVKTNAALKQYKEYMEGGEKDDAVKEAAEIYKGALEDIQTGRIDSNRMHAAAELFLGKDRLKELGYDLQKVAQELQNTVWQTLFDPNEASELDYGQRFAEYVRQNFTEADGVWVEGGNNFFFKNMQAVADAFDMSTASVGMFLSALDLYGVNVMRSVDDTQELIDRFMALRGDLAGTEEAVHQIVNELHADGYDDFEVYTVLDKLRESGVIDLNKDQLYASIDEALGKLADLDEQNAEPTTDMNYEPFVASYNDVVNLMNNLDTLTASPTVTMSFVSGEVPSQSDQSNSKSNSGQSKQNSSSFDGSYTKAHAGGKRASGGGGDTLVNELGPELISDQGKAFIANGGRPGFVRLSADAIVFTAEETKDILHGKRSVNGKALAGGNVGRGSLIARLTRGNVKSYALGSYPDGQHAWKCPNCGRVCGANASYCYGCGWPNIGQSTPKTTTDYYARDDGSYAVTYGGHEVYSYTPNTVSTYYDDAYVAAAQAAAEAAKREAELAERRRQISEAKAKAAAAQGYNTTSKNTGNKLSGSGGGNYVGGADYASVADPQKVDWVAVRINRLQRAVADLEKVATSGFKMLEDRLTAAKDQIAKVKDQLQVAHSAYARYIQEAESVGLSSDIAQKVKDGTIEISSYDDETRKKIDEYTEW